MGEETMIEKVRGWHKALPGNTKAKLSREAGLNARSLDELESDDWNPTIKTLRRLAAAVERLDAGAAAPKQPA